MAYSMRMPRTPPDTPHGRLLKANFTPEEIHDAFHPAPQRDPKLGPVPPISTTEGTFKRVYGMPRDLSVRCTCGEFPMAGDGICYYCNPE